MEDLEHIGALHSCLTKRVKAKSEADGFSSDCLFVQLNTLKSMEAEFVAVYLTTQTDLSMDDVLLINNFDSDQPWQLMVMDTGLHSAVKLPSQCKVKSVAFKVLQACSQMNGNPVADIKKQGGFNNEGKVNWMKVFAYKPEFDESSMLSHVVHRRGDEAIINAEDKIVSKSWQFLCNYSEKEAYFVKKPFKPIKLIDFFKNEDAGPNIMKKYWATNSKDLISLAAEKFRDHSQALTTLNHSADLKRTGAEMLKQQKDEKKRKHLEKTRAAAKEAGLQKRAKQLINM